jgi:hypothetical protein
MLRFVYCSEASRIAWGLELACWGVMSAALYWIPAVAT